MKEDKRKFKRKVSQSNPTNPTANTNIGTNRFDIEHTSLRDQKSKT